MENLRREAEKTDSNQNSNTDAYDQFVVSGNVNGQPLSMLEK